MVAIFAVTILTPLVWLAGLMVSLRGSKPGERAKILRAYGARPASTGAATVAQEQAMTTASATQVAM